jgi:putative ABC transport system permease protein
MRPVWLRHGVAGLAKPGAPTLGATVALGLGVLLVLGLGLVDRGVTDELRADLPSGAPTAFFIDIQPPQWSGVRDVLQEAGATHTDSVPIVTARLRAIDGKPVSELQDASPDSRSKRWALTREQRLTYLEELPADNRLLAGELWSDPERDELSIEQEFADDLGVGLGSRLTFDVQGVPLDLTVTSIREVDWRTFGINFFLVVEPGVLDRAPQQRVAASRLPELSEQMIQDRLAAEYPNVTMLRIRELLEKIATVLERLATGVRFLGTFSVLAGILILAGGVSAGTVRRSRQIALFKTLGMTRAEIVAMLTTEYAMIGAIAGSIGAVGGALLSWAVLTRGMDLQWRFHPEPLILAILLSVVLTAATGVSASWEALRRRPLEVLRSD